MAVIFDLDMTLVDSSVLEPLRRARRWPDVYRGIPRIVPYAGMLQILSDLKQHAVPTAIVTTSPRPYCRQVMEHFGFVADVTVCYHDTVHHKPNPAPILLAIDKLKVEARDVISIGDAEADIIASKAAGVIAVGALWGLAPIGANALIKATPHHAFNAVQDFSMFLKQRFGY